MGETQIYSQRLHGITEKRRILGEVDVIQRELELQKVKLQQLKRKSLRDRWLMDGLVPAPGAELENPLSETEDKIKKLEDELESLNLQLLYLENPELKIENMKKLQVSNAQRPLVNGDQSQEIPDQKEPTPAKRERRVIQEEDDIQPNGEDGKQEDVVEPLPKDEVVGHPIPAPRPIKVSENLTDQNPAPASPDQKLHVVDQRNEGHDEDKSINRSLEPQHDRSENVHLIKELEDESSNGEQDPLHQNSESLARRLELEEENVEHLKKELGYIDLSFNVEDLTVDTSQPSHSNEDMRSDSDNQYETAKETPIDNDDKSESETRRFLVMEKLDDQDEPLVRNNLDDKRQDMEVKPVLVTVIQDAGITVPARNQDQSEEPTILRCQEEPADPMSVLIGHNKVFEATSNTQLPCNDPEPSTSLPCEDIVSQVQISQVVVISAPGHASPDDPGQRSSASQPGPSPDLHHEPTTTPASTSPESQPLLHKPPATDGQSGPHGTNTAETRDMSTREKKTRCQCCVLM
ncbi:paralemmin-3 isoform X2 [Engystomops pustulosus]